MNISKIKPVQSLNGKWKLPSVTLTKPESPKADFVMETIQFNRVFNSENEALSFLKMYIEGRGIKVEHSLD